MFYTKSEEEIKAQVEKMIENTPEEQKKQQETAGMTLDDMRAILNGYMGNRPYIEGAWMTKYDGKYYLQYAITGTEFNVYGDGVYISDSPLGPFAPAQNNPYSYMPSGFITGAGHGSTLEDKEGNWWHTASLRISHNANFERRIGLWKAGFDQDGELFSDQRYGDWPINMDTPAYTQPDWMLLSFKKNATVSSGTGAEYLTDEDIRTFWRAGTNRPGEWAQVDLGEIVDVHAIQINFADDQLNGNIPENAQTFIYFYDERFLDTVKQRTNWMLEGSLDGKEFFLVEDKREVTTDYSHDLVIREGGIRIRFVRLTVYALPYEAVPAVAGIRVFGRGNGEAPQEAADVTIARISDLDMEVTWKAQGTSANVLWGYAPDKLYHSCMVYHSNQVKIGALVKGQPVYVRVDTFNENGITKGSISRKNDDTSGNLY